MKTQILLLLVLSLFLISATGAVFSAGWLFADFIIYLAKDIEMTKTPVIWTICLSLIALFSHFLLRLLLFVAARKDVNKKEGIIKNKFQEALDKKMAEARAQARS
jgi:hypothetical protein